MQRLNLTQTKEVDHPGVVIADKETSGKSFWQRFKEEKKEFEQKIFLHENVDDFKYYFTEKKKLYDGELHRKVLRTLKDFEGLRY